MGKRPYIPIDVKIDVALRQLQTTHWYPVFTECMLTDTRLEYLNWLRFLLGWEMQCPPDDLQLDHNPALSLRIRDEKTGLYTPDANDPNYLIYRSRHDHHIKTNVRGDGALRSDTSERVHRRKIERNKLRRKSPYRWPHRKMQSRPFPKITRPQR